MKTVLRKVTVRGVVLRWVVVGWFFALSTSASTAWAQEAGPDPNKQYYPKMVLQGVASVQWEGGWFPLDGAAKIYVRRGVGEGGILWIEYANDYDRDVKFSTLNTVRTADGQEPKTLCHVDLNLVQTWAIPLLKGEEISSVTIQSFQLQDTATPPNPNQRRPRPRN